MNIDKNEDDVIDASAKAKAKPREFGHELAIVVSWAAQRNPAAAQRNPAGGPAGGRISMGSQAARKYLVWTQRIVDKKKCLAVGNVSMANEARQQTIAMALQRHCSSVAPAHHGVVLSDIDNVPPMLLEDFMPESSLSAILNHGRMKWEDSVFGRGFYCIAEQLKLAVGPISKLGAVHRRISPSHVLLCAPQWRQQRLDSLRTSVADVPADDQFDAEEDRQCVARIVGWRCARLPPPAIADSLPAGCPSDPSSWFGNERAADNEGNEGLKALAAKLNMSPNIDQLYQAADEDGKTSFDLFGVGTTLLQVGVGVLFQNFTIGVGDGADQLAAVQAHMRQWFVEVCSHISAHTVRTLSPHTHWVHSRWSFTLFDLVLLSVERREGQRPQRAGLPRRVRRAAAAGRCWGCSVDRGRAHWHQPAHDDAGEIPRPAPVPRWCHGDPLSRE